MATIRPVMRPHTNKDGLNSISIRVLHKEENKLVSTGIKIPKSAWSATRNRVKKTYSGWIKLNEALDDLENKMNSKIRELEMSGRDYAIVDILLPDESEETPMFFPFAEEYIQKFKFGLRNTSFKRHKTILNKLKRFSSENLKFEDIDVAFLTKFEQHLASIGNSTNTIHGNIKVVRAVYYHGIKLGVVDQAQNPFFIFKLKKKRVYKEKLTEHEIQALHEIELEKDSMLWHTRNYFLASYYMAGMRFADICLLKGGNFSESRLEYTMSKTGTKISLEANDHLYDILKQYNASAKEERDFIFPLLKTDSNYSNPDTLSNDISSRNAQVNKMLKVLAKLCGIRKNLTFHIARHSFADISRKKGVDIYDISKLLGHSSIKITEDYLASLDQDSVDNALRKAYN